MATASEHGIVGSSGHQLYRYHDHRFWVRFARARDTYRESLRVGSAVFVYVMESRYGHRRMLQVSSCVGAPLSHWMVKEPQSVTTRIWGIKTAAKARFGINI